MNTLREIHTRAELLACLREDPMRRIVTRVCDGPLIVQYPRMFRECECEQRGWGEEVALVAEGSDAAAFLDEIYSIEGCGTESFPDEQDLAKLLLRCGPGCSEYCLPEYLKEYSRAISDSDLPEIQSRAELLTCLQVNATKRHIEEIRDKLTVVETREDDREVEIVTIASDSDAWKFLREIEEEFLSWQRARKSYAWPYALGTEFPFERWCLLEHPDLEKWNDEEDESFLEFLNDNPGLPEVSP